MNVLLVQPNILWENKPANYATVRRLLAEAAPEPETLVILPEMFATGFSMNMEACAEEYGGETERFLGDIAGERRVWLIAGAAMRDRKGAVYNKALVFSPLGELLTYYSKMRLFSPGKEMEYCTAGERVVVFEWRGIKVSPFVCYDLRFPELFREAVAQGEPELFVVIANWPAKRMGHWLRLLAGRAVENQAFVIGVNRVGADPFYEYGGHSIVIDPHGETVVDAGTDEGWLQTRLDFEPLRQYRQGLPFLKDLVARRADR